MHRGYHPHAFAIATMSADDAATPTTYNQRLSDIETSV